MSLKRNLTLLALLMVLCMAMAGATLNAFRHLPGLRPAMGGQALVPNAYATPGIDLQAVTKTARILKDEYVEDFSARTLLNSGLTGIRAYCKYKKIKANVGDLSLLPGGDLDSLLPLFSRKITDFLTANAGAVKENDIYYAALVGMLEIFHAKPFKDPHSIVMTPKEYGDLNDQLNGASFGGVGIYLGLDMKHGKQLMVAEPIEDTPAFKAGLRPYDLIVKINGVRSASLSTKPDVMIDLAAKRIKGPPGTPVTLTILRGKAAPFDVTLTREQIKVKTVSVKMLDQSIGYIRIRSFGMDTAKLFSDALIFTEAHGAKGLIVDLRGNGGGYIQAAIEVCGNFMPRGALVVKVVYRKGRAPEIHRSAGQTHSALPIVLLVNEFSASASEITAGALRDSGMAILMGHKTFGKGSVQEIEDLSDGGAVKYTIAHYMTPKGYNISKQGGLAPDLKVDMAKDSLIGSADDLQLAAAIKYLKGKIAQRP